MPATQTPLEWLDVAPAYQGPSYFQQPSQALGFRATRDRALAMEQMKQQEMQLRIQDQYQRMQQEQAAQAAAPYLTALDPMGDNYGQQRATALRSIPPAAIMDRGVQSYIQANDYSNRINAKPDIRVDAILTEHPELQDDFEIELGQVGKATAVKNLRNRASDRTLRKQLSDYGFDFSKRDELEALKLEGKPFLDPVSVGSWIKRQGSKGLDQATSLKLEEDYNQALDKADAALTPESKARYMKQAAKIGKQLGVNTDAVPAPASLAPAAAPVGGTKSGQVIPVEGDGWGLKVIKK